MSFRAADKYVIVAIGSERLWERFCVALDIAQTIGRDPRFATNKDRLQHRDVLIPLLQEVFASRPASHWLERLKSADIPCGPINEVDEALADPQIVARGMIVTQEHSTAGTVHSLGNPIHMSDTAPTYRLPPPALGEHTESLLGEAGYSAADVRELHLAGAI
jgi:crotonobetainyl-CoA:carnitine CoA-transferase CaiB-like acyl-CoA transferase